MAKLKILFGLVILFVMAWGFIHYNYLHQEVPLIEQEKDPQLNEETLERIPLYYDLDDPTKVYTRGEGDTFKEVILDGRSG